MRITALRLMAALGLLGLAESSASAQGCGPGGCGPTLSASSALFGCGEGGCVGNGVGLFGPDRRTWLRRPDGNQPACATRTYPISDWAYIRKYCGPSLIPGTCYGHFQTKWRRWEEACPQQAEPETACASQYYGTALPGAGQPGSPVMPQPHQPVMPYQPGNPHILPSPTPLPPATSVPSVPGAGVPTQALPQPTPVPSTSLAPGRPSPLLPALQPISIPNSDGRY